MNIHVLCLYVLLVVVTAVGSPNLLVRSKNKIIKINQLKSPETVCHYDKRIYGGHNVKKISKFPFMAYVYIVTYDFRGYKCGGSILSPKYILTAGHCVKNCKPVDGNRIMSRVPVKKKCKELVPENYEIYVGRIIPILDNPHEVKKYFVHPKYEDYDYKNQCFSNYDLAILELRIPLKFNERISSVRLPPPTFLNTNDRFQTTQTNCIILGWGLTNVEVDTGKAKELLQEGLKVASVKIISNKQCINKLKRSVNESIYKDNMDLCMTTQLCTIDPKERNGFCGGDSEGPLMCGGLQVGVISWGVKDCAGPHIPNIYSKVDVSVKWIRKIISRF